MPPKIKFTKQDVVNAAYEITREKGADAVNARAVAAVLGCSTQPLFREFSSMEELKAAVVQKAMHRYEEYIAKSASLSDRPYKGTGMAYILFAREEPELFKLLFMCDRSETGADNLSQDKTMGYILDKIMEMTGFSRETALDFHLRLWIFTHGLAVMLATKYVPLTDEQVDALLSDEYTAMVMKYKTK